MMEPLIDGLTARADEFADAFENHEPKPGDLNAALPPVMASKLAVWRSDGERRQATGDTNSATPA